MRVKRKRNSGSIKATGLVGARGRDPRGEPLVSIEQPRDRVFSAADASNSKSISRAQSSNARSRFDVDEERDIGSITRR